MSFFSENLSRKFKLLSSLTRITVAVHKELGTFFVSHLIRLRMRNDADKICRGNQNTFHVQQFPIPENHAVF